MIHMSLKKIIIIKIFQISPAAVVIGTLRLGLRKYCIFSYCDKEPFLFLMTIFSSYFFSWVHLDAGQYWSDRAAELSGHSHRELFNSNMNRLYKGLYRNAKKAHC